MTIININAFYINYIGAIYIYMLAYLHDYNESGAINK